MYIPGQFKWTLVVWLSGYNATNLLIFLLPHQSWHLKVHSCWLS